MPENKICLPFLAPQIMRQKNRNRIYHESARAKRSASEEVHDHSFNILEEDRFYFCAAGKEMRWRVLTASCVPATRGQNWNKSRFKEHDD